MIGSGLCGCGCGAATPIASQTDSRSGAEIGQPVRFVKGHQARLRRGDGHPSWKGGRTRMADGYVLVHCPSHPRAYKTGYVLEHVLVASAALGRPLPRGVVVHHRNDDTSDNRNGNLVILQNQREHIQLHVRRTVLRAGGNPWTQRVCCTCREPKDYAEFYRPERGGECRDCSKAGAKVRQQHRTRRRRAA